MAFWDNTRSGGQSSGGGGGMYKQNAARPAGTFSGAFQRRPVTASGPGAVARMGGVQRPSPASNQPMNGPGYATNIGQVQPQPRTAPQMPVQGIPAGSVRPPMQAVPAPAPPPTPAPLSRLQRAQPQPQPVASPPPPPPPVERPPVYDAPQQGLGGMVDDGAVLAPQGQAAVGARPVRPVVQENPAGGGPPLYDPPQEEILPAAQQFGKAR